MHHVHRKKISLKHDMMHRCACASCRVSMTSLRCTFLHHVVSQSCLTPFSSMCGRLRGELNSLTNDQTPCIVHTLFCWKWSTNSVQTHTHVSGESCDEHNLFDFDAQFPTWNVPNNMDAWLHGFQTCVCCIRFVQTVFPFFNMYFQIVCFNIECVQMNKLKKHIGCVSMKFYIVRVFNFDFQIDPPPIQTWPGQVAAKSRLNLDWIWTESRVILDILIILIYHHHHHHHVVVVYEHGRRLYAVVGPNLVRAAD